MESSNSTNHTLDIYTSIDTSATDAGEDTQSNYRFQNLCTSIIALNMYRGATEYVAIFCELYEDVTAMKENGNFVGIQIKHKTGSGVYSLTTKQNKKTVLRFAELEMKYPQKFDKFIIMSNANVTAKQYSLGDLTAYCQNRHKEKKSDMEEVLAMFCSQTNHSISHIATILAKTEYTKVPDRDYILDHIANNCVAPIPECRDKTPLQLKSLVNVIANLISQKSTMHNSLNDYFVFMSNSRRKRDQDKIAHKQITKDEIKTIINQNKK